MVGEAVLGKGWKGHPGAGAAATGLAHGRGVFCRCTAFNEGLGASHNVRFPRLWGCRGGEWHEVGEVGRDAVDTEVVEILGCFSKAVAEGGGGVKEFDGGRVVESLRNGVKIAEPGCQVVGDGVDGDAGDPISTLLPWDEPPAGGMWLVAEFVGIDV